MLSKLLDSIRSALGGGYDGFRERRVVIRLPWRLTVNCARGDIVFTALMVDIGLGGMRLEVPAGTLVKVGDTITVTRPAKRQEEGLFACEVRWIRPAHHMHWLLGLQFRDSKENMRQSWVRTYLREVGFNDSFYRQRRQHIRVPCSIGAVARLDSGELIMKGHIHDLSISGATLLGPMLITKGVTFLLDLGPHRPQPIVKLKARVMACQDNPATQETIHRVQFVDTTTAQQKVLRSYVRQLLREIATGGG